MKIRLPLEKSLSDIVSSNSRTRLARYAFLFFACAFMTAAFLSTGKFGAQAIGSDGTETVSQDGLSEQPPSPLANLGLVIRIVEDGVAPLNTATDTLNGNPICPTALTPGCDFSYNNRIIRTNDQVTYLYEYSVNGGDEANTVLTAYAPVGTIWDAFYRQTGPPAFCDPGSSINSGDGTQGNQSILICKLGTIAGGTSVGLPFTATVRGDMINDSIINASGILTGGSGSITGAGGPDITVTAAPRFNLRKSFANQLVSETVGGVQGYTIHYNATLEVRDDDSNPSTLNPRYGSSVLTEPITFVDDVSDISSQAKLVECLPMGAITCSQLSAGQNINVSITGADTTLGQYNTPPGNGLFIVGTYRIKIFVPKTVVDSAPDQQLTTVNHYTQFDPWGPTRLPDYSIDDTGVSNFGSLSEDPGDNHATVFVREGGSGGPPGNGVFTKLFLDSNLNNRGTFGLIAPEEEFFAYVQLTNDTIAPLTDVYLCDVIDNTKYNVIGATAGDVFTTGGSVSPTEVRFGIGYSEGGPPTGPTPNDLRIQRECKNIGWEPIGSFYPPSIPANTLPNITRFRAYYPSLGVGQTVFIRVTLKARNTGTDLLPIPPGTVFPNFAVWKNGAGDYTQNNYSPNTASENPDGGVGARLIMARAVVRIVKATENNNTVNSIETGSGVGIGFVLLPTITTSGPVGPVPVVVTDVLPRGLNLGESVPVPAKTTCGAIHPISARPSPCVFDDQVVLTWDLGPKTPNTPIDPIVYRVTAGLEVTNNQNLSNTAIISSPADPSNEPLRTSIRNIIGATPSTFLVYKKTYKPLVDVNENITYEVSYRNSSLVTSFTGMDFIDILPFQNDSPLIFGTGTHIRVPVSMFHGSLDLDPDDPLSASTSSASWYFTDEDPLTISLNPKDLNNINPGAPGGIWCNGTESGPDIGPLGDCDFDNIDDVTAVRMRDNVVLPRSNTIRTFTLNLKPANNQGEDVYTNNSGGSVNELTLPVSSINVPVVVRDGAIGGMVWYDTNGDGIRQIAETGRVTPSTVKLDGTTNGVHRTMTTTAAGTYSFTGLPGGSYTVTFTRPVNYRVSPQNADSDGDPLTLVAAVPAAGALGSDSIDQGFYQLNLGGTIWNDKNDDGNQPLAGEGPIGGSMGFDLELIDAATGMPVRKALSSGGEYSFANLPAGDYFVRLATVIRPSSVFHPFPNDNVDRDNNGVQESGNTIVSNAISLAPGAEPEIDHSTGKTFNRTLDFGLFLQPTSAGVAVGGRVTTSDGRGIGKVTLTMTDSAGMAYQALTNPFGYYRFDGVAAGTTVFLSAEAKGYTFLGPRVITVSDDLTEVNFVPIE